MNTHQSNKPTTGRLWYGDKVIAQDLPFRNLQHKRTVLIHMGYDKKFFRITY